MADISIEQLDYGAYICDPGYTGPVPFNEAVRYATADFTKLYMQKVRLPDGRGNIIYLMSKSLDSSLKLLNNFIIPGVYRRVWYPVWGRGTFIRKRYSFSIQNRKERDDMIRKQSSLSPYLTKSINHSTNENLLIACDTVYNTLEQLMTRMPVKTISDSFYSEYVRILNGFTPAVPEDAKPDPNSYNRILIIDCDGFSFKQGAPLKENKTNPLYIMYLSFLRNKDLSKLKIDIDIVISSKNMFVKFNPARITKADWAFFRKALFKIMNANLDDYTEKLDDEDKKELPSTADDHTVSQVVRKTVEPYTKNISGSTKEVLINAIENKVRQNAAVKAAIDKEVKLATNNQDKPKEEPDIFQKSIMHSDPVNHPLDPRTAKLFTAVDSQYHSLAAETSIEVEDDEAYDEGDLESDAQEVLTQDEDVAEEVLDEIQDHTAPLDHPATSPANTARDKKLRDQQKKVVVGNETIEDILNRDSTNVPIEVEDKSKVMHTTNDNMKQIRFANFDKTYIDDLYMKDIVACFDCLKDKDYPFYVTGVTVQDTSTAVDFKDTWTVRLVDEVNKRYTITVDLPKFQNDRFMWLNGTRYIIQKQNLYNPLVKDTPDAVILTTNFNKVTIRRVATKSLTAIERIFSLVRKTGDSKMFIAGNSSSGNMRYISSLEYDELSGKIFKFVTKGCELCFSRDWIKDNWLDDDAKVQALNLKGSEFLIGYEGPDPVIVDEDSGFDRKGRTITQVIEQHLPDNYRSIYDSIKAPKQSMYADCKMAGQNIPIITALIVWNGLKKSLDLMGIKWKFDDNMKRVPADTPQTKYIRFSDGVLSYESQTFAELIMNGMQLMHPSEFRFQDFENETGYEEFMYAQWGSYNGINEIRHFNQFLVDPITRQVCKDQMLPDTPSGLLIHATKLLCDNAHVSKASDKSYRVRSLEIIPAILYECLSKQYKAYVRSGRRIPMTLTRRCVISKLLSVETVEAYSTLNPVVEVSKTHTISTRGYKGSNSDHSYDEEKRSYDPSAVGKLAISTSPDAKVGVQKNLTVEPAVSNARGYREPTDEAELKDVNVFSPVEMLTPSTAIGDDPIRTAIDPSLPQICWGERLLNPLSQ